MDSRHSTAAAAGTWTLGDVTVNRVGFGAMRLPQRGKAFDVNAASRDRVQAIAVLRRAVELGVNHIDTAAFYFSALRSANELINRALAPYPDDLVIATKVGPGRDPSGEWLPWATPGRLRGQVEENLRQLGRDHLDVVYLRAYGRGPLTEHFATLAKLREAGLIRHLGVSAVDAAQLAEARRVAPVVAVQNSFGLGYRHGQDEFVRACGDQGTAFVPFFSIAGAGRETGAVADDDPRLLELARSHGVSTAQLRLAWMLRQGPHVLVIPGTGDPDHLLENVAAAEIGLSATDMATLESVHRGADDEPGRA